VREKKKRKGRNLKIPEKSAAPHQRNRGVSPNLSLPGAPLKDQPARGGPPPGMVDLNQTPKFNSQKKEMKKTGETKSPKKALDGLCFAKLWAFFNKGRKVGE